MQASPTSQRRRYNSPSRRRQTAETRDRIISAGAQIVHQFPTWDWTNLTVSIVGMRAGVSVRTVQRHFPSERQLREAVLGRLVDESRISLETITLDNFDNVIKQLFGYLSSFKAQPITPLVTDPTFALIDQFRRDILVGMVTEKSPSWSDRDRETVAAVLDIIWTLPPYERLITSWGFDIDRAIGALSWIVALIREAVQMGWCPDGRKTN